MALMATIALLIVVALGVAIPAAYTARARRARS